MLPCVFIYKCVLILFFPAKIFRHYLLRPWAAVSLFLGSLLRSLCTKSLASGDTAGQGESLKLGSTRSTERKIPDSVRAQKGLLPHNNIYVMTPILHISASTLYIL